VKRLKRCLQQILLAGVFVLPVSITACAVHARYYDPVYADYHAWSPGERAYYTRWEADSHHTHQDYEKRPEAEQREYWTWRHGHPNDKK
jgi:hypothetical protein